MADRRRGEQLFYVDRSRGSDSRNDQGGQYSGSRGPQRGGGGGGYKRKREDEPEDSARQILSRIIVVGDKTQEQIGVALEDELEQLSKDLLREASIGAEVQNLILDSVVELSTKTQLYASLLGLLNNEDSEFVIKLLDAARADCEAAMAYGDCHRTRMLLRFFASLAATNVLYPSSVLKALQGVISTALEVAEAGGTQDSGRTWQPYTDFLVYAVLIALPWGGNELCLSAPEELEKLWTAIAAYIAQRPRAYQPALRPFYDASEDADAAGQSDSGGASFLPQVWEAVKQLKEAGSWTCGSIPEPFSAFEARFASAQAHELGAIHAPKTPPPATVGASPLEVAAAVGRTFGPRGGIRLLAAEHTQGDRPAIERLVLEEYMLDIIRCFDGDRVEQSQRLATALPTDFKTEPLLAETLFAQMLRLPEPALKPVAYSTIMVDLCRLLQPFPRSMSACVRECFGRLPRMAPPLRARFARWLAYHLSSFEFVWPWDKWRAVLEAPAWDAQRRFVQSVLQHLVQLSYWERVESVLPEGFHQLLPPKPEVVAWEEAAPAAAVADAAEGGPIDGAAAEGDVAEAGGAERELGAECLHWIKNKRTGEDIEQWAQQRGVRGALGGAAAWLRLLLRALLVASAKSLTHMTVVLERYRELLAALISEIGPEGEAAAVGAACDTWRNAPLRAEAAVQRLQDLGLVGGLAVAGWVFGAEAVRVAAAPQPPDWQWGLLYEAVDRAVQGGAGPPEVCLMESAMEVDGVKAENGTSHGEHAANGGSGKQNQEELLLEVLRHFKELLSRGAGTAEGEGAAEEEKDAQESWFGFTVAQLKAFTLRYALQLAPLAGRIEDEEFAEGAVDPRVREAVVSALHF